MLLTNSGASVAQFGAFRLNVAYHLSQIGYANKGDLLQFLHVYLIDKEEEVYIGNLNMQNTPLPDLLYYLQDRLNRQDNIIDELTSWAEIVDDPVELAKHRQNDQKSLTQAEISHLQSGAKERVAEAKHVYQRLAQEIAALHKLYPNTSATDSLVHRIGGFAAPAFSQALMRLVFVNKAGFAQEQLTTKFNLEPKIKTLGQFSVHPLRSRIPIDIEGTSIAYYAILLEIDTHDSIEVGVMGVDEIDSLRMQQRITLCLTQLNYTIIDLQNIYMRMKLQEEGEQLLYLVNQLLYQRNVIELALNML